MKDKSAMRVYRLDPKTDQKQFPILQEGFFVLGNPAHGDQKHLARNQVLVRTEQEMINLIIKGYAVRVATDAAPSLVRLNLHVDGRKIS